MEWCSYCNLRLKVYPGPMACQYNCTNRAVFNRSKMKVRGLRADAFYDRHWRVMLAVGCEASSVARGGAGWLPRRVPLIVRSTRFSNGALRPPGASRHVIFGGQQKADHHWPDKENQGNRLNLLVSAPLCRRTSPGIRSSLHRRMVQYTTWDRGGIRSEKAA